MKEGKGQFTDELGNPEPIGERVGARVNVSQTRCAADKAEVPTNRGSGALRASTRGVGRSFGLVAPAVYACVIRDRCVSAALPLDAVISRDFGYCPPTFLQTPAAASPG